MACIISSAVYSQNSLDLITEKNSREILEFLASDKLKGRVNFSSGQIRAAEFIGQHFEQYGLKPFLKAKSFYHPFTLTNNLDKVTSPNIVHWNRKKLSPRQFYYSNPLPEVLPMQLSDFRIIKHDKLFLRDSMEVFINDDMPLLVWGLSKDVEGSYYGMIQRMKEVHHKRVLLVFDPSTPESLSVNADASSVSRVLYNVAGILPGTLKAGEIVIISAHYDHVSEDASGRKGLYNGANDNASGVTALLQLANYYSRIGPQERTILFIAFAGEELGLKGSALFSQKIKPKEVICQINVEMIGRYKYSFENSFFITGESYSDLAKIMAKNLEGTGVEKVKEFYSPVDLFIRSDNLPFYVRGIPAHTIMCSADDDPCYHHECDDAESIDYTNMTNIIRGIAFGIRTIATGRDTPRLSR